MQTMQFFNRAMRVTYTFFSYVILTIMFTITFCYSIV